VAEAAADPVLSEELERFWTEQRTGLPFDDAAVDASLADLRSRFANSRIEHRLSQIATDGSQKLGPRILDPLRSRLAAGREPGDAQLGTLAAWALHLGTPARRDPAAEPLAERLRDARDAAQRAALVLQALAPDPSDPVRTAGLTDPLARRIDGLAAHRSRTSPPPPSHPSASRPSPSRPHGAHA
jgi:fructuronate reductase